jgi:hypothetical protein
MNPICRTQLNNARTAAGGRPLTDAQAANIEARLSATMRRLARQDPQQWMATPPDQRMLLAAQQAAGDIAAEAARKVANAQRQVLKTAELETRLPQSGKTGRTAQLVHDFERTNAYVDGVKRDNVRGLMDLIEAADDRQGASVGRQALMILFDAQNPVMTRDLALEVFANGKAGTGNASAKAGADAWLKVTEAMRQRFNAAGGDVGRLDYGYLPQAHDQAMVRSAGSAAWIAQQRSLLGAAASIVKEPPPAFAANAWANDVLPLLDRSRYIKEDGARMTDAETLTALRGAWETISSDGANKSAPGAFKGTGARANRGAESREIHFKDGAAYLAYQQQFGTGSMYDAMIGHIGGLARDIGLVERYGPNPEAQMRVQFDLAERADGANTRVFANKADAYWRLLNGAAGTPESARVAQVGQHIRNIETFGKLQGAVLSSITDMGTYFVTAGYNNLSYFDAARNIGGGKSAREFMNAHGLIAESMISDLNRWAGENVAQSWSGRIAAATMRLSLMNAWTDTLRRGFQMTHMQALGKMRGTDWGNLAEYDRWRMGQHGITADDWGVLQAAQPVAHNGRDFITPDAIYATGNPRAGEVVAKYLGMISDESEVAVLNPDMATRALSTAGASRAGTIDGELWRAVMQFKSFPIAMISRHWRRMLETPQGMEGAPMMANRLAYSGALMVSLTALGAVAFQSKQMVSGKDPVDMTTPKFWTRSFAQGGGMGFMGDILLGDTTDDRSPLDSLSKLLLGPSFGSAADLYELTKGNVDEALAGKDTHAGAEAMRFARGHLPLVNLWYAKTALDHAGLHALQENLSPGYLARVQSKARKDWGQDYWWSPGTGGPDRAPSFAEMAGP